MCVCVCVCVCVYVYVYIYIYIYTNIFWAVIFWSWRPVEDFFGGGGVYDG